MGGYGEGFKLRGGTECKNNKEKRGKEWKSGSRRRYEKKKEIEMKQMGRSGIRGEFRMALHFRVRDCQTVNSCQSVVQ